MEQKNRNRKLKRADKAKEGEAMNGVSDVDRSLISAIEGLETEMKEAIHDLSVCCGIADSVLINGRIKVLLERLKGLCHDLKVEALEQDSFQLEEQIAQMAKAHSSIYRTLEREWRSANLKCKSNVESQCPKDSAVLMTFSNLNSNNLREVNRIQTTKDKTDELRRTKDMLATELERSNAALEVIGSSSNVVRRALQQHSVLNTGIQEAHTLTRHAWWKAFKEKLQLRFALAFFIAVVIYIFLMRFPLPSFVRFSGAGNGTKL
ncbi:protein transport protein SEC20 [Pelomyxa schiedti]|nr:protein transport protein SEC20 [Pelomyxa schiedti]